MSINWVNDITRMHDKYGHLSAVRRLDNATMEKLLDFRIKFLSEELTELRIAKKERSAEDVVDAIIDLCVVAIGTLHLFEVDTKAAWDDVLRANLGKKNGIKSGRPNPLGLPDLVKPKGWVGPDHDDRCGRLHHIFKRNDDES